MAIIKGNTRIQKVSGITLQDENDILNFFQGAISTQTKRNKSDWFSLRDLMGGTNSNWSGTPLFKLYEKHLSSAKSPSEMAGRDAGWLLKKAISNHPLDFETEKSEMTRKYRKI